MYNWPVRAHYEVAYGDAGTFGDTIPWMAKLVKEGREHPLVKDRALQVVSSRRDLHPVDAIFRHVRSMPYRFDEDFVASEGIDKRTHEVLQGAPLQAWRDVSLGPQAVEGDCDCRAIYLQSMLESVGYPTRFVVVKGPGRNDFSHVYSEALVDSAWVPLDTIMDGLGGRPYFNAGDEVPPNLGRDKLSIPVDGGSSPLAACALLAAAVWWLRG